MTIQVPNPGTGNGATGDNEFVLWSKVKANFEDQTNAANKEVGISVGKIPMSEQLFDSLSTSFTNKRVAYNTDPANDVHNIEKGLYTVSSINKNPPPLSGFVDVYATTTGRTRLLMAFPWNDGNFAIKRYNQDSGVWSGWYKYYNNQNTTLDSNGAIKPSSPVLRVFSDRIEGNDDGDAMSATYTKNGVGDYVITGTTGLRSDGWYIVIPNDINGNPKVAVTLDDTDGVITLKTYARIFDMTTFKFAPDLNQPLDIPDGRWIDLRFNDVEIDEV